MIIGLMGLKGSGKDTVGAYLVKQHNFERRSFAEPLKRSFAALFDIPMSEIEDHKNNDNVMMAIGYENYAIALDGGQTQPARMWSPIKSFTFRHALQRYGTEAHREIFGKDFWVDRALPVEGFYAGRNIVVTDCRFQNEITRIHDLGGHVVRVDRPAADTKDHHRSENEWQELDADYVILNNGGFVDLYKKIEDMLEVVVGV